jgi:hypothetical protein
MVLKATRFLNLLLTGVLTGNEFGGFVGFHPALYVLPTAAHASAERAITGRFGKVMPPFMTAAILSFVPVLSLAEDRRSLPTSSRWRGCSATHRCSRSPSPATCRSTGGCSRWIRARFRVRCS